MEAIVDSLYDGVLSIAAWNSALQSACDQLDAYAFHHINIDCTTRAVGSVTASVNSTPPPLEKLIEYETYYAARDVRMGLFWSVREGQIMLDHEHLPASTFASEPIYADFLASLGMRHTACIPALDGQQSREFLGFMRHLDQRPYGAAERASLQQLQPHVVRANRLRVRSSELADQAALGCEALELLPQGAVVLGAQCEVRYANAAARRWLASASSSIAVRHGRLQCADPAVQEQLAYRVALACGTGPTSQRTAGEVRLVPVPGAAGFDASVLPLQASHALSTSWQSTPHALLTWRCGDAPWQVELVGARLGLTPVESSLALHIARGGSVKSFALKHGCSWHTARTHMKNLLRKTGVHSRGELAHLVIGGQ